MTKLLKIAMDTFLADDEFRAIYESEEINGDMTLLTRKQTWVHVFCEIHFLLGSNRYTPRDEGHRKMLENYHNLFSKKRRKPAEHSASKKSRSTTAAAGGGTPGAAATQDGGDLQS